MPGSFNLNTPNPVQDLRAGLDLAWDWDRQNAERAARQDAWEQERLSRNNQARAAGRYRDLAGDLSGMTSRSGEPLARSDWRPPAAAPQTSVTPQAGVVPPETGAPQAPVATPEERDAAIRAAGRAARGEPREDNTLTERPGLDRRAQSREAVVAVAHYRNLIRAYRDVGGRYDPQVLGRVIDRLVATGVLSTPAATEEYNRIHAIMIRPGGGRRPRVKQGPQNADTGAVAGSIAGSIAMEASRPTVVTPTSAAPASAAPRRADQIDWTATGIPGLRLTQAIRPEGERPRGGAERSQHYLSMGGTAVDFNIDAPGGGIVTEEPPGLRARIAQLAGVPVEQVRGGFTNRGTAPHFHYEWGTSSGGAPPANGGTQYAAGSADGDGDAAEPVRLAFAAFSDSPARIGIARRRADAIAQAQFDIAVGYFDGGDIENGVAALQSAMQAVEAGEVIDNYDAVMRVTMGGNSDRFRELIASQFAMDPNDLDFVADQAAGQIVMVTRDGPEGEWQELNRFTPEELRHFGMFATDAAYRERAEENAADIQEAMIRYQQALGVAEVSGQYDIAQELMRQGGENQRAEFDAQVEAGNRQPNIETTNDGTFMIVDGQTFISAEEDDVNGNPQRVWRPVSRPRTTAGLLGGP